MPKKFRGNKIKFLLDLRVAESQDEGTREVLRNRLAALLGYGPKKLTRLLTNTSRTTVEELVAASQVLGASLDDLVLLEEAGPETVATAQ